MTGRVRRSRPGRSWKLTLATSAAALLVAAAALRVLFPDSTAEAAERRSDSASTSGTDPASVPLPAPTNAGPQALSVPAAVLPEPVDPPAPPASDARFAGLAALPHEAF